ncbi:hypothetical protein C8R47DRAFT_1073811 [Mycena vitilis]|nr:hypothetical protein C8R47DRAFT_1073811 [Mycena vitilis]
MAPPMPSSSLIVEAWVYGLYTATLLLTLGMIVQGKHYTGSRKYRQIGLILASYLCSSFHAALNWAYFSAAVDDNETPTGPGLIFSLTHMGAWMQGVADTFFCLNVFLADCLFIWRCWVIWSRRWKIVVLPMLATISGLLLAGFIVADQVTAAQSSEPLTAAKTSKEFVQLSTIYFSLSVATSLTTTFLIIMRLALFQRMSKRLGTGAHSQSLNSVIEILIESALLYSITLLTFVVLDANKDVNLYYAQNIHAQMAGFAPLLIILRVAAGKSRSQEEWSAGGSSTVKFASNTSTILTSKTDVQS